MTQAFSDIASANDNNQEVQSVGVSRAGMRYLAAEVGVAAWMPLRVLLRHWPVLFAVGVAGVGAREGFIRLAVWLAGFNAMLGLLVWLLAPLSVMITVVLMLIAVRPSLSSVRGLDRPESLVRDLGSVLIPFVAFYLAFGLFEEDYREYNAGLLGTYNSISALLENPNQTVPSVPLVTEGGTKIVSLLIVVAVAFGLRWALNKWDVTRRNPVLGIPGAYLESIWVILGGLFVIKQWVNGLQTWAGERRAWHAVLDWWHGLAPDVGALGRLYRTVDDWLVAAFPSGDFNRVFVVPITGLVAAAVVYNLTVSDVLRPPGTRGPQWFRWLTRGLAVGVSRRFGPLIQGVRAMARSGAVPIMFFCLSMVALQTAAQWLRKAEHALVGPRVPGSVQYGLQASLEGVNSVLTFVLLVCVLAAAVDGVARRNGRGGAASGAAGREPDITRQGDDVVDTHRDGLGAGR